MMRYDDERFWTDSICEVHVLFSPPSEARYRYPYSLFYYHKDLAHILYNLALHSLVS